MDVSDSKSAAYWTQRIYPENVFGSSGIVIEITFCEHCIFWYRPWHIWVCQQSTERVKANLLWNKISKVNFHYTTGVLCHVIHCSVGLKSIMWPHMTSWRHVMSWRQTVMSHDIVLYHWGGAKCSSHKPRHTDTHMWLILLPRPLMQEVKKKIMTEKRSQWRNFLGIISYLHSSPKETQFFESCISLGKIVQSELPHGQA